MLALTLWQPWASAVLLRLKRWETRSWFPNCPDGTWIGIHASALQPSPAEVRLRARSWEEIGLERRLEDLRSVGSTFRDAQESASFRRELSGRLLEVAAAEPYGALIAVARLARAVQVDAINGNEIVTLDRQTMRRSKFTVPQPELEWGHWAETRIVWEFDKIWRLRQPVPSRGRQRLWNVPGDLATQALAQVPAEASA